VIRSSHRVSYFAGAVIVMYAYYPLCDFQPLPLLVLRSPATLPGDGDLLLTFGDDGTPQYSAYSPRLRPVNAAPAPTAGEKAVPACGRRS